jgi:hypothetical protein
MLILAATSLAGCNSGNSSSYTEYGLNHQFTDHPVNEFFHIYGFPIGRFEKTTGNIVYQWASAQQDAFPPQAHPVTYYSEKGNYQIVDNYQNGTQRQYCALRIYTDRQETIRRIEIAVDSIGKWSSSRCSELF